MWTWGAWGRVTPLALATFAVFGLLVMPVMAGASGTMQTLPAIALAAVAYLGARRWSRNGRGQQRAQIVAGAAWLLLLPATLVLLLVRGGVEPGLWGGLYLNVIVASSALIGALPVV